MHIVEAIKRGSVSWRASRPIWLWEEKMKIFTAVTLVVFLCCLEVALCYPSWPAAKPRGRPQGLSVGTPGSTGGNTLRRLGKTQGMLEKPKSHVLKTAIAQQGIWIIMVHVILWLWKVYCNTGYEIQERCYCMTRCSGPEISVDSKDECCQMGGRSYRKSSYYFDYCFEPCN